MLFSGWKKVNTVGKYWLLEKMVPVLVKNSYLLIVNVHSACIHGIKLFVECAIFLYIVVILE